MTPSYPPTGASFRIFLNRAASAARSVAILLVTMTAIRFAVAAFQHALGVTGANFAEMPSPHPSGEPGASQPSPFAASPGDRAEGRAGFAARAVPAGSSAGSAPAPGGRSFRISLVVSAGPPRSEVYVNGQLVGHTPFLGDMACKAALPIRIEIVPEQGAPLTYLRECRGGTIEIEGPPP